MFEWIRKTKPPERKSGLQALIALSNPGDGYSAGWGRADAARYVHDGYAQNPVVFRCVRMIAEACASVPLEVRRADALAEQDDAALNLLNRPNSEQTRASFFEALIGHLQVSGDAFAELVAVEGRAQSLYVLRPDRMKVVAGNRGWPVGWEQRVGSRLVRYARDFATGRSPILHLKSFHPGDDHYGLSPLAAAGFAVDTHAASGRWNKALLDNAARPSGALVFSGNEAGNHLTTEQIERLREELEAAHSGPSAAGRPLLLEGGLDWKPFGLSPSDMDFVEAKSVAAREIALAFGVPPMLLGIPGDNTYSNYREANLAFWRQTILPLSKRTAEAFEIWLRPWLGEDLAVRCAPDDVPALSEERSAIWRRVDEASFLTRQEKRQALGLPPEAPNVADVAASAHQAGERG